MMAICLGTAWGCGLTVCLSQMDGLVPARSGADDGKPRTGQFREGLGVTTGLDRQILVLANLVCRGLPSREGGVDGTAAGEVPCIGRRGIEDGTFPVETVSGADFDFVESIKSVASNLVKKVQRLIRPEKKIHKEVIY